MDDAIQRIVEGIVARVTGPMHLRFMLQPAMAILLGIRDGRLDAKAGIVPFIWKLVFEPGERKKALKSALGTLLTPIIIGTLMDAIAQYLIFQHIRPMVALLVGTFVMGLPYAAARALSNRIATSMAKRREDVKQG
jgi:hypothetical protein